MGVGLCYLRTETYESLLDRALDLLLISFRTRWLHIHFASPWINFHAKNWFGIIIYCCLIGCASLKPLHGPPKSILFHGIRTGRVHSHGLACIWISCFSCRHLLLLSRILRHSNLLQHWSLLFLEEKRWARMNCWTEPFCSDMGFDIDKSSCGNRRTWSTSSLFYTISLSQTLQRTPTY